MAEENNGVLTVYKIPNDAKFPSVGINGNFGNGEEESRIYENVGLHEALARAERDGLKLSRRGIGTIYSVSIGEKI